MKDASPQSLHRTLAGLGVLSTFFGLIMGGQVDTAVKFAPAKVPFYTSLMNGCFTVAALLMVVSAVLYALRVHAGLSYRRQQLQQTAETTESNASPDDVTAAVSKTKSQVLMDRD